MKRVEFIRRFAMGNKCLEQDLRSEAGYWGGLFRIK
jgi:hypothetical protein